MKKSKKAVLLSALVFPGLGHLFLKRYGTGLLLIGIASAATYLLIVNTVERSLRIMDDIQNGTQLNTADLASLVSHQSAGQTSQLLDMAPTILLICWIIGIVDSYRIGRVQDKVETVKMANKNE